MLEQINLIPEILIKLDVQGFEDRVIKGGIETFKKAKVVLAEVSFQELYIGQELFDGIYNRLKELGFDFKGIIETNLRPQDGLPLYADALFVKEA